MAQAQLNKVLDGDRWQVPQSVAGEESASGGGGTPYQQAGDARRTIHVEEIWGWEGVSPSREPAPIPWRPDIEGNRIQMR